MPILICCKKNVHSLKKQCSHVIFFKFCMKNALLSCTWLVKKRQVCQNYTLLCAKKVNRMIFFPIFSKKNNCSHAPIFCQKMSILLKNISYVHILSKKCSFSQKHSALMSYFFKIFHKKPPTVMPKLCQKTSILSKLHYFIGHESP